MLDCDWLVVMNVAVSGVKVVRMISRSNIFKSGRSYVGKVGVATGNSDWLYLGVAKEDA